MIIHLRSSVNSQEASQLADSIKAFHIVSDGKNVLITGSGLKEVPDLIADKVDEFWVFPNDIQLASRKYLGKTREVNIGNVTIGGDSKNTQLIGRPCSVESEDQIRNSAELIVGLGLTTLRGG